MSNLKPCPFCGGEAEMLTAEIRYTKTLENIVGIYTNGIDFKLLHESAAPHWVDLLEG